MKSIVYKTNNEVEATLVKHSLENNNIEVYSEHDTLKGVFDGISGNVATINLLVDEENYNRSLEIIKKINEKKVNTSKNVQQVSFKHILKGTFLSFIIVLIIIGLIKLISLIH